MKQNLPAWPTRRRFAAGLLAALPPGTHARRGIEFVQQRDLLTAWRENILAEAHNRYCDSEMGEEIGWLIAPVLEGFHKGFLATNDTAWIDRLIDWTDAWIRRGVVEPDGNLGWPKFGAAGNDVDNLNRYFADSMVGEAMVLRPIVRCAAGIIKNEMLARRYGVKARSYIQVAINIFDKWNRRGNWRLAGNGEIPVVLPIGIDQKTRHWTDETGDLTSPRIGFSYQNNKANLVAMWLMAMSDATAEPKYRQRAEAWFRIMKARLRPRSDGSYEIWNYWEPIGRWDFKAMGVPKHWIGQHPNPEYYEIDVRAIVTAYKHGLVFTDDDMNRLIRTAIVTNRTWSALSPYDPTIRKRFEQELEPKSWKGMVLVPWYLAIQTTPRWKSFTP